MFGRSFSTCPSSTCGNTYPCVDPIKRASKLEYQDDSIGCRKINALANLLAVRDDASACYIVCDIVCDIIYDISLHIVHDITRTYDIVYKDAISQYAI